MTRSICELLETSYQKCGLVHLPTGSVIPLLKNNYWLVIRGMAKLGAVSVHGDELLLGLVVPNESFGELLTTVEAYEAITLCDCDLLCLTAAEVEQSPQLAMAMVEAISVRYRQAEHVPGLLGLGGSRSVCVASWSYCSRLWTSI